MLRGIAYKPIQVRKQTLQKLRWRSICCVIHYSEQFLLPVFLTVLIESLHDSVGEDDQIVSRIQAGPSYLVGNALGNPQRDASHLQAFDRAGSSPQKSLNRSEIKVDSGGRSLLGQRRCHEAESEQGRGNYLAQQLFEGKKVQRRNIRPLCKAQ